MNSLRLPRRGVWSNHSLWIVLLITVLVTATFAFHSNLFAGDSVPSVLASAPGDATTMDDVGGEDARLVSLPWAFWFAPIGAVLALVFAFIFHKSMLANSPGTPTQQEIAKAVREGAMAYLFRQYKTLAIFFVLVSIVLAIMAFVLKIQHWLVPFAFITGGFFSGLCGWLGMNTATLASNRTSAAATDEKDGLNKGLQVAFRSGAVMGLVVVGFGLIDIVAWFLLLKFGVFGPITLEQITVVMLCFGMGASSQALFARVGGGIYTKAADVGGDLVGKVEAGIPEDDPRNAATIADNVGDNVGDVAGMGADLYESYCGSILASAALGVAAVAALFVLASQNGAGSTEAKLFGLDAATLQNESTTLAAKMDWQIKFLVLPMAMAGIGIVLSILGVFGVRTKEGASFSELLKALGFPILWTSVLIGVATIGLTILLLGFQFIGIGIAGVIGLFAGVWIGNRTEYFTSFDFKPTQNISKAGEYGPATVIIQGVATGMLATAWPVVTVVAAIILSYGFAGGFTNPALGLYGVALSAVGMLATLGYTLATDAYGPIADNAGGNSEMSGLPHEVRKRTDLLDALGNTTAATGKGFAIGSAALTAMALIAAYLEEVRIGLMRSAEALVTSVASMAKIAHHSEITNIATIPAASQEAIAKSLATLHLGLHNGVFCLTTPAGLVPIKNATFAQFMDFYSITLMNPMVLVGLFIGAMAAFAFCALTMLAVGRAAQAMVAEVRRQFRTIPGIMDYKPGDNSPENIARRPQYAKCVDIATLGAQREMVLPSVMAVVIPVVVGLLFGVAGVVGLLGGAMCCGFVLAVMMAAAGGAWDNAKKWVEARERLKIKDLWSGNPDIDAKFAATEKLLGFDNPDMRYKTRYSNTNPDTVIDSTNNVKLGEIWNDPVKFHKYLTEKPELWDRRPERIIDGKRSFTHGANVVGDTVGDPFKDTSGPALNILIKLMSMVGVVFAPLTVMYGQQIMNWWQTVFSKLYGG